MDKSKKTTSSYDTVFDFIFSIQKSKINKPFRKVQPESGIYNSALIEIGTQPAIYPLESVFNSINSYIKKETEVDLGGGISAGISSDVLKGPGAYSKKEISKNRAKTNFARIGAGLHYGIDGALISLLSRYNGAAAKNAYVAGSLFADTQRAKHSNRIFGVDTERSEEEKDKELFNRGASLMSSTIARTNPSLEKARIMNIIKEGQKIVDRNERIHFTVNNLRLSGIRDSKESLKIAELLWGNNEKELGLYKVKKDSVKERLKGIEFKGEGSRKVKAHNKSVYDMKINRILISDMDVKRKKREIYSILKNGYKLDSKEANIYAQDLLIARKANSGIDIADYAVYNSLVLDTQSRALAKGDYEAIRKARQSVSSLLETQKSKKSLGTRVARATLLYNWIKESGAWGETFLNGNWEKLGTDDLNFTKVVTEKEVKDSDGKVIGRYLQASNSVIGKLLGKFYYLHPVNFIRGVFLEGDLLLKLASRKNGELNKKSFAYLLYNARLGKVFSAFAKPMKILSSKFAIMINPLSIGIKNFVRGVLRRILGATGLGGWLLMKIMDLIGDRITYLMNQIVLILLLGVIGLLFVFLESTGLLYSNQKASVIQGVNSVSDIVISGEYFTDEDFVLPEFEK